MGPEDLSGLLGDLNPEDPCIICDMRGNEDAGVYKISEDSALVQTVDFITPVVDDPFTFGKIAAANSMSDVWAMGGRVVNVLNVVGYDKINLTLEHLKEIFRGSAEMVRASGAVTMGGHTIENMEMFFGLACTGLIHPDRVVRNSTAQVGDVLILTKGLGIGALTTGIKRGKVDAELEQRIIDTMLNTNQAASEIMLRYQVSACTDITGFGLLGHALEMASEDKTLELKFGDIPQIPNGLEFIRRGIYPGGTRKNYEYLLSRTDFSESVGEAEGLFLSDPQTSGGLLMAVAAERAEALKAALIAGGYADAAVVGRVLPRAEKPLSVL